MFHPIVLDRRQILDSFKDVVVMFISMRLNWDAHHMVVIGKRVGSRDFLGSIPDLNSNSDFFSCNSFASHP